MYYFLMDIASHKTLRVDGFNADKLSLVDTDEMATAWTDRREAMAYAEKVMNDFSHSLAGRIFEVTRG